MNGQQKSSRSSGKEVKEFIRLCCQSTARRTSSAVFHQIKKSRTELIDERKKRLSEVIGSGAPEAIIVYACLIYLRAYFGSERKMVFGIIYGNIEWRLKSFLYLSKYYFERIYYLLVKRCSKDGDKPDGTKIRELRKR